MGWTFWDYHFRNHTELLVCGFCPIQKVQSMIVEWMMRRIWAETVSQPSVFLVKVHPKWITCAVFYAYSCCDCTSFLIFSCTLALFLDLFVVWNCSETQGRPRYVFSVNHVDSIKCSTLFFKFIFFFTIVSYFLQELWLTCLQIRSQ